MPFNSIWLGAGYPSAMASYLVSPWSFYARQLRGANADFSLVNYATFWFRIPGPAGFLNLQHTAPSNLYHSEKEVWMAFRGWASLNRLTIPNWRIGEPPLAPGVIRQTPDQVFGHDGSYIYAVYTERQPCGTCSPFLNDILRDGTLVGWHFPYPSKETKKHSHSDDDIATNGLMALSKGKSYEGALKDHQREWRVEGNKDLKTCIGSIKNGLGHCMPMDLSTD